MSEKKEERIYRSFIISICLVVGLSISGIFLGMTIRTRNLLYDELASEI